MRCAVEKGSVKCVELLLAHGVDVNQVSDIPHRWANGVMVLTRGVVVVVVVVVMVVVV